MPKLLRGPQGLARSGPCPSLTCSPSSPSHAGVQPPWPVFWLFSGERWSSPSASKPLRLCLCLDPSFPSSGLRPPWCHSELNSKAPHQRGLLSQPKLNSDPLLSLCTLFAPLRTPPHLFSESVYPFIVFRSVPRGWEHLQASDNVCLVPHTAYDGYLVNGGVGTLSWSQVWIPQADSSGNLWFSPGLQES